jgi:hypothetical protein
VSFEYLGTAVDDKREIEQIYGPEPNDSREVCMNHWLGHAGVTRIVAYHENGGLGPVTWFEVWTGDVMAERVNGLYVASVRYKAEAARA